MPSLIVACEVMREELLRVRARAPARFTFLPMSLHVSPARLHAALAEALRDPGDAARIVLGFGLCGYATAGLVSPRAPLLVPRVHDCIALLTGGRGLVDGVSPEKGTFYLSGGWMEGERTLAAEHRRATARFGEARARRILKTMLDPYRRFTFVRTDHPRRSEREEDAARLSGLVGLPMATLDGDPSRLERLVNGPWKEPEFVRVAPGEPVPADAFVQTWPPAPGRGPGAGCDENPQGPGARSR